jgi:hypothetical protein
MISPGSDRYDEASSAPRQLRRPGRRLMWLFALAVLVPSLYGFGTKFFEFVALFRGDVEGVFAITPIMNYLLASFGFLLLFGWAAMGGMFRDVERPKYAMLENEAWLDRVQGAGRVPQAFAESAPGVDPLASQRFQLNPRRRDFHD